MVATVWRLYYMRSEMRASQAESDDRLSKQIHAGLTAWASNGGGQQIRLIVRDEIDQALGLHLDRDHALREQGG